MPDALSLIWLSIFGALLLFDIVFQHYVNRVWLAFMFCFNCAYYPDQWSFFPGMALIVNLAALPMLLAFWLLLYKSTRFRAWCNTPMWLPGCERKTDDAAG